MERSKRLTGLNENPNLEGMANSISNGNVENLANHINIFLNSVSVDLKPLGVYSDIFDIVDAEPVQTNHWIDSEDVSNMLSNIKVHKAHGPYGLPNWLLRDFAPVLCKPVCAIFNTSIQEGLVPIQWKMANVTMIPKVNLPKSVEFDLRPISLFQQWHANSGF